MENIALGSKAIQESQFYSSLHENNQENSLPVVPSQDLKFDSSAWDLIRGQASLEDNQKTFNETEEEINSDDIVEGIEEVLADLKTRIRESSVVAQGTKEYNITGIIFKCSTW